MADSSPTKPSCIRGGCLCGDVRYEIDLENASWPPKLHTCSCTDCRKNAGSLIVHWLDLAFESLSWKGRKELVEYSHTTTTHRGFCPRCGSTLTWRAAEGNEIEISVGSIDEEFLVGKNAWGRQLTEPTAGNFYSANHIEGFPYSKVGERFSEG